MAATEVFKPTEDFFVVRTSWQQWLAGWTLIWGLLVFGALLLIGIQAGGAEAWKELLGEWAVLGVFSDIAWVVHWYCVFPMHACTATPPSLPPPIATLRIRASDCDTALTFGRFEAVSGHYVAS